jgi:hypothetical protein
MLFILAHFAKLDEINNILHSEKRFYVSFLIRISFRYLLNTIIIFLLLGIRYTRYTFVGDQCH